MKQANTVSSDKGRKQMRTDAVSQFSTLAYVGKTKDLLPFFAPSFPFPSSTCGDRVKQEVKMFYWKNFIKLSTFIFICEEKMKA